MLIDKYNRKIDYLRISVTDRCNLRCIYCMPSCGISNKPHQELLTFEEIVEITKVAVKLGIDRVRLTGGEPLIRKNLVGLVGTLNKIEGIKDISLTTNGILLKEYALDLKNAGLRRVNISLDSLRAERYRLITRQGNLEQVLDGIAEAFKVDLQPIKINILLLDNIDKDEVTDFLRLTVENSLHIRFLEFMPINSFYKGENFISGKAALDIAQGFSVIEEFSVEGNGPARVYKFKNSLGTFGIISPISQKFCSNCNRLRLTSDGFLKVCLHSDLKVNLRDSLRKGASQEELAKLIRLAVDMKPREHSLDKNNIKTTEYSMCQIGG